MIDYKIKNKAGREGNKANRNLTYLKALLVTLFVLTSSLVGLRQLALFFNSNELKTRKLDVSITLPKLWFDKREPEILLVPIVKEIPIVEGEQEQYICDKFGLLNCQVALAVMRAESGGNPEAYNYNTNGTLDIGLWQINEIHWDRCGGLAELVDPQKNTDCAYTIWDRADGVEGNGKGSFDAWTVFWNGRMEEEL